MEKMIFGPVPDVGAKTRLVMRPRVSVRDVLAAISPAALVRLRDAAFDLTEYSEDEPQEERLVRALIEPELPDGLADEWFQPYSELGLDELFPLVVRLRVVNSADYVVVHELWGMGRPFYEVNANEDFAQISYDLWSELTPDEALYTVALDCDLSELKARRRTPVAGSTTSGSLEGLVSRLADEIRALVSGKRLLRDAGAPGCLAALAGTLWTVAQQPVARTRHRVPRLRAEAFDFCLRALRLGPHEEIVRRVLIRNHPGHIPVDVRHLPPGWTAAAWGGTLGIFEREGETLVANPRTCICKA
ncbi:MAG TPA: hypothetical protein VG734_01650 [Lacunisphaera sp.]|nr:hypothetical protein [Lacunisphaera sp.]